MVDQAKRDALKVGILTGLGATLLPRASVASAHLVDGPTIYDTIEFLHNPIRIELLIMRVRRLMSIFSERAATRSHQYPLQRNDLLMELRAANDGVVINNLFHNLYGLRDDRIRHNVLVNLGSFSDGLRINWVSEELDKLRNRAVEIVLSTSTPSCEVRVVSEVVRSLDHVEYIVQSERDPNSNEEQTLFWCEVPLIRCLGCDHPCSFW